MRQAYDVVVEHCAFELHPGIPLEGQQVPWPPEHMAAARQRFAQVADAEGLAYGDRTHWYNSIPAHEAALWADAHGDGETFRRCVYRAYFADGLNIAQPEILADLARTANLDGDGLLRSLADGEFREQVQEQFEYARSAGITGVPAYVAGNYLMVGAQPYEVFCQLIETVQG
ncbi:MAG: DsbA family protein [Chloroflexi bacterium]|nr:DsbA family protein [Chloroflexota bacterium]